MENSPFVDAFPIGKGGFVQLTYPKPNVLTFGQYIKCFPKKVSLFISREFGEVSQSFILVYWSVQGFDSND